LREQMSWHEHARGWITGRLITHIDNKESTEDEEFPNFDLVIFDPLHMTWEAGTDGLVWACHHYKAPKAIIKKRWDIKLHKDEKEADVYDFYDDTNNWVVIEGNLTVVDFAKKKKKHGLDRVPVFVVSVGSMPFIQRKDGGSTIEMRGDSILASSRGLFPVFNKSTSVMMDAAERGVSGSMVLKTDEEKTIEGDPFKTFQIIQIGQEDELKPLERPKAPEENGAILSIVQSELQQSSPPPIAYGIIPQAMSGAALNILSENMRSIFAPRTSALEQAYTWICEELLQQWEQKGAKGATFRGYDSNDKFFQTTIKPTDIDPGWFVKVICRPRMPRDQESEIMMAMTASQPRGVGGMPLLSDYTIWEELLKLADPHGE
ncbi:unnamed protein product, partial [marine sediment metagenome]